MIDGRPSDILGRYRLILELTDQRDRKSKRGGLLELFDARLVSSPGSARFEALIYSLLDYEFNIGPEVYEKPGTGGPDFKVTDNRFGTAFIECKYLDRDAVTKHSGLQEDPRTGGSYSIMTERLQSAIGSSTPQLSDLPSPGICFLGTDHRNTLDLFAEHGATTVLTGTTVIRIPIDPTGTGTRDHHLFAPLEDSAFLRPAEYPDEPLNARRRPISGVVLVTFDFDVPSASLFGILNPFAIRPLNHRLLPGVPFARFAKTPELGDTHLPPVEFVVAKPGRKVIEYIFRPEIPESLIVPDSEADRKAPD